jgi:chemotaxis protein CheX
VDVKYADPFIESFTAIMPQLGYSQIQSGDLSEKDQELVHSGVNIIVGIVGGIKGNVVYSMGLETAKKIASTMMMGMPVDELDEMSKSALSELANMLTASAATAFYNMGIQVDISTPTLLHGENITIKMSSSQVICVQLLADDIMIEANVAFEK